jgi:A/G-specific adenine glycosylase
VRIPSNALRFKRALLRWYRAKGRALPWRETRDPYRVLVSEFMLQQTQVSRVVDYYDRFLARFGTVGELAESPPRAVREAWDGLGYYRRAENLHRLARAVVNDHDGRIPDDPAVLRTLPGVGPYTAGAVASFAFERRAAAVDTNVARVLRRVFRNGRALRARQVWELATRILPRERRVVWEFNQALMDLGATICTARRPKCVECPVRSACTVGRKINGRTGGREDVRT